METKTKLHRILVPTDFSESSRAAVEYARTLQEAFGGTIDLLHVVERVPFVAPEPVLAGHGGTLVSIEQLAWENAKVEMRKTIEDLRRSGMTGVDFALERGSPPDRIVTAAEDYDLIVMGTHGRTGLAHLLLGSVTERVVRLAPCPVLCVRQPRPAADVQVTRT